MDSATLRSVDTVACTLTLGGGAAESFRDPHP